MMIHYVSIQQMMILFCVSRTDSNLRYRATHTSVTNVFLLFASVEGGEFWWCISLVFDIDLLPGGNCFKFSDGVPVMIMNSK